MHEDFLHFVWRYRRFCLQDLCTTTGERVEIVSPGIWNNRDSGPDFLGARIKIDGVLWAGQVEIHLLSSDWYAHRHHSDPAYGSVVLHVVLSEDRPVIMPSGQRLPCIELKSRLQADLYKRYQALQSETLPIPCGKHLADVPEITIAAWLERMSVERLESYCARLDALMATYQDRDFAFWTLVARALGAPANSEPMEILMQRVPISLLVRMRERPGFARALLLGLASLLPEDDSLSSRHLCRLFRQMTDDYDLRPLDRHIWKRARMRPGSLPEVRVAQLASLISAAPDLWSVIRAASDIREIKRQFKSAFVAGAAAQGAPLAGLELIDKLIINVVVPFVFAYGKQQGETQLTERALSWWLQIKPEDNYVTRLWHDLQIKAVNAAQTQGLLHLERHYCRHKKCLECAVGLSLLRTATPGVEESDKIFFSYTLAQIKEAYVPLHRQT